MLENTFLTILDMSVTASVAAASIILLRWVLADRLPKAFSYFLWAIVLIRLLVPFSITSVFSIFNAISLPDVPITQSMQYNNAGSFTTETGLEGVTREWALGNALVSYASGFLPEATPAASVDPIQVFIFAASLIWFLGAVCISVFSIIAYLRALHRLNEAVLYKQHDLISSCSSLLGLKRKVQVYTSEKIHTPIVCGLMKPRLILPAGLAQSLSELELKHIITHELVHIKRYDHIIKPLAFLILCVHWFNPLMWLCFKLSQKDMEMSCDERVLSVSSRDIRSEYAKSLINIAIKRNTSLGAGLLAFGENNITSRVKGIMKFKKAKVWIGVAAAVFIMLFGLVFLTNGQYGENTQEGNVNLPANLVDDKGLNNLLMHRSHYIGDASNVGSLLGKLPYGKEKSGISLDTGSKPYGITVDYSLEEVNKIQNVEPVLLDNALILFSLIENVDTVVFKIHSTEQYEFQYTRTELQRYFEKELWTYSNDKGSFGEFLMNISFDILVFPEKYTPAMSSVPGMRIDTSLNAAYFSIGLSREISVDNGSLHTWDINSGKISEPQKSIVLKNGPVYWSPLNMADAKQDDFVTISILDGNGSTIIEKRINIIKEGEFYIVKPSHDVLTDNIYN